MQNTYESLFSNVLFKNVNPTLICSCIHQEAITQIKYKKNTLIASEGEPCTSIGLVVEGTIIAEQISLSGESLTINHFNANDAFAVAMFTEKDPTYPFTLTTASEATVIYLPFELIDQLLEQDLAFNRNMILFMSQRIHVLKSKLLTIQHKHVRDRIIGYLSDIHMHTGQIAFELPHSKTAISNMIGVARPSLSRAFSLMSESGIIAIDGNHVELKQLHYFKK